MRITCRTRVNAFTLAEFSVALTILTLISGLMLSSLFFMNKWSYNYQSVTNKYEDLFDCATVFKTDCYLSDLIGIGNNKVEFVNVNGDTIDYRFLEHFLVREVNNVYYDTIHIANYFDINLNMINSESDSFTLTLILYSDTMKVNCEVPNVMLEYKN